jgi:hypothetical protein
MQPKTVDRLSEIKELRRWQIAELGEPFIGVFTGTGTDASPPTTVPTSDDDSPYAD